MIKLAYIISSVEKSLMFEWVIEFLDKNRYNLFIVLLGKKDTPFEKYLIKNNIQYQIIPFNSMKDFIPCSIKLFAALLKLKPDVVHAHLFDAGRMAMPLSWLLRVKKRIYTRHYGNYHHQYFPLAVTYDKMINFFSTQIIAISLNVKTILSEWEEVSLNKIAYVPHGFNFEYFESVNTKDANELKRKYGIPSDCFTIGVISRYTKWKGIEFIIEGFTNLHKDYPSAHLILANAVGDDAERIRQLLTLNLPSSAYTEIKFENNIAALYSIFDVFVHVPIDKYSEAFGQTYVEALAMKVPSVFTLSGIADEFVQHEINAMVVDYKNSDQIYESCKRLIKQPLLGEKLKKNGLDAVTERFDIRKMVEKLDSLYQLG